MGARPVLAGPAYAVGQEGWPVSSRAAKFMEALSHNERVTLRLFDSEENAIYYVEGRGIFQVLTGDTTPRNRQKLNPRIAQVTDGVYSTARKSKDHTFRNYAAYGISKFVFDRHDQFGFTTVEMDTPRGLGRAYVLDILAGIETGAVKICRESQAGYESQYLLTPEMLGLPAEEPNAEV